MPLMSGIACGLAVDEERAAGRLANLTALPSRGRAVLAKWLALTLMGAGALAVAFAVFGTALACVGRLPRARPPSHSPGLAPPSEASRSTRSASPWRCGLDATSQSGWARRERCSRSSPLGASRTGS